MDKTRLLTNWIWVPGWTARDEEEPRIVCFRRVFEADKIPSVHRIRVSAESRYKLYINGCFVQAGPQKALDKYEWFVDTVDIAPYLREGKNVAAVEVLRYPAPQLSGTAPSGNDSLLHTVMAGLFIEDAETTSGFSLNGKAGWKCRVREDIRVVGEIARPAPIHAQEEVAADETFIGWQEADYDDAVWKAAESKIIFDLSVGEAPGNLVSRTIPPMRTEESRFEAISKVREGGEEIKPSWTNLILNDAPVIIPAHTRQVIDLSAGEEMCGYLLYAFAGGKDAAIETLCSECYGYPQPPVQFALGGEMPGLPLKGDRTDAEKGDLQGHASHYTVVGGGTAHHPEAYEPFWMRTFRYVRLTIETKDAPLTILRFAYHSTGYPLDVKTAFACSDETMAPIWDISVRTLRRCMHETYMDCPFYEQLQYAMDTRSEVLYTYMISADDRLARQAMEAFRRCQRPDGAINSCAPANRSNVIPGFAIFYLLMVHDHMMYFGDKALVRQHLPAIDRVLTFFGDHLNSLGVVGKVGGKIMRSRYWSFIDWSTKWEGGVPNASDQGTGAITMESLLYLFGLQHAAELADYVGFPDMAQDYRSRAGALKAAIQDHCMGEYKGQRLVQDGPGINEYSVHCQAFALLTGVVSPEEGRAMLEKTVGNPDLAQSSVAFMFYLFRALEMCGWYEKTDELWELWRQMVRDNLTTCVENDTDARSDCHAWASLLCYEMPAVVLGVRPGAPGFEKILVKPCPGKLTHAEGSVITPKGLVHVKWEKQSNGEILLQTDLPDEMKEEAP